MGPDDHTSNHGWFEDDDDVNVDEIHDVDERRLTPDETRALEEYREKRDRGRARNWARPDGSEMSISQMEDTHLFNSIKMLERIQRERGFLVERRRMNLEFMRAELVTRGLVEDFARFCSGCQRVHTKSQGAECKTIYCRSCKARHVQPVNVHHAAVLNCNSGFKKRTR